MEHELPAPVGAPTAEYAVEIPAARQPSSSLARPGIGRATHHTVKRLRPLSRRRFSVSRPARVCIRARKPCVLARLRFFGW